MKIIHINMELTRACNLRCSYCFNGSGIRLPNELSTDGWKEVIDNAIESGARSILLTGGELMARPDSIDIIRYSINKGLETSLLSNGYRIRELGDLITSLRRVQISLDSTDPAVHDSTRGKGSWQVAIDAIKFARSRGTPVEISITVSPKTVSELGGVARIAVETGSKVLVRPLQSIGRASRLENEGLGEVLISKLNTLKAVYGDIFVEDFARYVPILGKEHDSVVFAAGFVTVLPDGSFRGLNRSISTINRTVLN
jgi:MoaA/NifB/PqqE/SkfB family radical SAM enzyme